RRGRAPPGFGPWGALASGGRRPSGGAGRGARRHLVQAGQGQALRGFDRLMARFDSVVDHLVRQPRTLVHGDVFPHNIVLQPGPRIRPIDWEAAAVGLAAWDLARLLDGWGKDRPPFTLA